MDGMQLRYMYTCTVHVWIVRIVHLYKNGSLDTCICVGSAGGKSGRLLVI